jgi:hypothetical protein
MMKVATAPVEPVQSPDASWIVQLPDKDIVPAGTFHT